MIMGQLNLAMFRWGKSAVAELQHFRATVGVNVYDTAHVQVLFLVGVWQFGEPRTQTLDKAHPLTGCCPDPKGSMLDHTLTTQNGTCLIHSAATKVIDSDVQPGVTDKTTDSKRRQPRYLQPAPRVCTFRVSTDRPAAAGSTTALTVPLRPAVALCL
ncbi:hypothetical protein MTOK_51830 [Mycolicibacterium tokaiense]|nr:hypothetical protein MTOK_51830 [Mycolicibacterium tokaiense]